MKRNVTAVILAGGVGSRLWPLSREKRPKQFISIDGKNSLLSNTLKRLPELNIENVIVVCNFEHRFLVAETLRKHDLLNNNIILEPCGRNTAAAIAMAALHVNKIFGSEQHLLILAADHVINNIANFSKAYFDGYDLSQLNKLVTFGVVPTYPETGYGYIRIGAEINKSSYEIECFVEKPDLALAEQFLATKNYLWNSGMFLFKANFFLEELRKYRDDILACCIESYDCSVIDEDFIKIPTAVFSKCASESIDYAIMEKSSARAVVPLDAGWSDVGSWDSIWHLASKDSLGNVLDGDILALETHGSYIRSESRLITTYGVNDLIVVDSDDALLITSKNKSQHVKYIVELLKKKTRPEIISGLKELRYWGEITTVLSQNEYKINLLTLKPGKEISYQIHSQRIECWYILKGEASIIVDDKSFKYNASDFVLIKPGCKHKVQNLTPEPILIIEIQHGNLNDECDVERLIAEG
ncbi:mannose-1-phosphate guanylyltransferase/mannose-6-phosphate isomerase [Escherichia coli]|uniref:mannose-1-phosphate guanylyltransferase/mannose-6-phosphate isomerase n=1 Tax=Escherichia coli TaxID=562 RepID=UPI00215A1CBD|nr:mannose-1-phosphate guanylyltransferase/mannose-6-phosphate isomerase [Escherichia coli]